jgi:hypothetical protein
MVVKNKKLGIFARILRKLKPPKKGLIERSILHGKKEFCAIKETIFIASYESSLTAESFLNLNLSEFLSEKYNVIHYVAQKSQSYKEYLDRCFLLVEANEYQGDMLHIGTVIDYLNKQYGIKIAIYNSLEVLPVLESANYVGVATLFMFQDHALYKKDCLNKELFDLMLFADGIVLPSKTIQDSYLKQLMKFTLTEEAPKNMIVKQLPGCLSKDILYFDLNTVDNYKSISNQTKDYLNFLNEQINFFHKHNCENRLIVHAIKDSNAMNFDYMGNQFNTEDEAIYKHVMLYRKNIAYLGAVNPRPGFSNLKWQIENKNDYFVPIYDALRKGRLATHACHVISSDAKYETIIFRGKIAVHLHLYYVDLSDEFASYFKNLPTGYDLYITTVSKDSENYIKQKFSNCGATNVEICVVDNIGRDVGPMIFNLREKLYSGNYEVIGHFHTKKSLGNDKVIGDEWRKYLLDNLIGSHVNMILNLFNDKEMGLIFTDDNTFVDIGKNKTYIDSLSKILGLGNIEQTPVFPVGNMFWARTEAIRDFFELNKEGILQREPLPVDGSYLHALERLTPYLAEKNGYKYTTIYTLGTSHRSENKLGS